MKVQTEKLADVLKTVKLGVDNKERLEQSNSFIFNNGYVYTYNDEITLMYPFDIGFEGALPAIEVLSLVNKTSDTEIEIVENTDKTVTITGKRFNVKLQLEDVFLPMIAEDINEVSEWFDIPQDFTEAVKTVSMAVSKNLSVPVLSCIHWKDNLIESCDNFRILQWKFSNANYKDFDVSVFGTTLAKLIKFEFTKVGISKAWLIFKNSNNGLIAGIKRFVSPYPDLELLKTKFNDTNSTVQIEFPAETISMLERASIFATADEMGDKFVNISIDGKVLTVTATTANAQFVETTDAVMKNINTLFSFTARVDLLKDILKLTNIAEVCLDPPVIKFETDNVYHLVLLEG